MFLKFKTYLFFFLFFFASPAFANNLVISNVTLEDRNASANTMVVQFDISWDHSWRKSDGRHDAAWVFVKLYQNSTAPWIHGKLYTAGTNPTNTSPGTNSDVKIVIPSDKIGAFISRKAVGNGTFSSTKVRLTVDYGTSGLADSDTVTAKVFGIEMAYVPEGPFYAGNGDDSNADEVARTNIQNSADAFLSIFNSSGTFEWAKRLGGTGSDHGKGTTVNSNGDVIATGYIDGNVDLNGDGDTADTNESTGGIYAGADIFISMFNSAGTFQWAERLGGTSLFDFGFAASAGSNNNIVVTGYVIGNTDLNGDADTADTNESAGGVYSAEDIFISVFNSAGTFQWSERLGGTLTDTGYATSVDSNNNVIVSGYVNRNADLNGDADTGDSNETGQSGVYAGSDIFVSVFNSAGTFQWSERLGGTGTDYYGYTTAVGGNNNVIVTGTVSGNVDLNGDADTADTNESTGGVYSSDDIFVSVFNSAGTFQWSERLGGTSFDNGYGVTSDSNSNVIVTGTVSGNVDLNGDADTADTNESTGGVYSSDDIFVSVFNSAGTFQWSERLGGLSSDYGYAIAVASNGTIAITGRVTNNADLNGDGDTADANESAVGGVYADSDPFISVFNSAGTFLWARRWGGTTTDDGYATAFGSNNSVAVAGYANGSADLNSDAAITTTYGFYTTGDDDSAVQITTSASTVTVDTNSNDDIDTTPITVTGLAGIGGNTSWPNGYDDFYMMKYEITQGQYVDFLNTLTREQQVTRVTAGSGINGDTIATYYVMSPGTTVASRQGIRAPASGNGTSPTTVVFGNDFNANGTFNETDDGQTIAMNYLTWMSLLAYADWAGLRPITELEFEKANHGPNSVTYGEYAWGSTNITGVTSITNSGFGTEVSGQSGEGLSNYNAGGAGGPMRAGFAATNATNRKAAGAGYYGNMNLSENLTERVVTLGNSTGRAFTGTHGDGTLTSTASFEGNATNTDWPGINATTARGVTAATGSGTKGGGWNTTTAQYLTASDRTTASTVSGSSNNIGGRLGRTAP